VFIQCVEIEPISPLKGIFNVPDLEPHFAFDHV